MTATIFTYSQMEMGGDRNEFHYRFVKNKDSIWVIVDRLTKSAQFIAINQTDSCGKLVDVFIKEVVSKHGVRQTIVSDRGSIFIAEFWKHLQMSLGSKLNFHTAYHPQTGGQNERTNQILKDMLR